MTGPGDPDAGLDGQFAAAQRERLGDGRAGALRDTQRLTLSPQVLAELVVELGPRAVFENMDVQKGFGRGVADLRAVLNAGWMPGSAST